MNISLLKRPIERAQERPLDESLPVTTREVTGTGVQVKQRLWHRMARECEAIGQHALGTGRIIPFEVMERLDQAVSAPEAPTAAAALSRRNVGDASFEDAAAVSAPVVEISPFASLCVAHAALARIIAPATPEAVLLMADERARHPLWCEFGPVRLVRQMLGLAIISLVGLLAVSISEYVNPVNMSKSLLTLQGYPLLIVEVFLLSAASLGGCFANLQKINAVISDGTYDPRIQSTYWTRWVMGVISGVVLSQLIFELLQGPTTDAAAPALTIGQPILALLGGYSVDLVHGILRHTINTLGNFFRGSADASVESQERGRIAEALAQERLSAASDLVDLQRALTQNPDVEEIRKRLARAGARSLLYLGHTLNAPADAHLQKVLR
jgi:hypothetical protein